MDYLKSVVPSQLLSERGSNLVVISPEHRRNVQDQLLNTQVATTLYKDRQKAYDMIASFLKIPFIDKEVANNSYPRKMGHIDGLKPHNSRKDTALDWTDVYEKEPSSSSALESSENKGTTSEGLSQHEGADTEELGSGNHKYKKVIYGEEALKISPQRPGVSEACRSVELSDTLTLWGFGVSVQPSTEGLAAAFGNGLSTACVIKMGAQVTSVICIEHSWIMPKSGRVGLPLWSSTYDNVSVVSSIVHDGAALPNTEKTLPFGGEDISRCLLWTQRHHQTWPQIRTDMFTKLIDLLMRNRLKESYCEIKEGELDAVGVVHSYEDGMPAGSHAYPPPPGVWFRDYEDLLEDTWHMEFPRRPEMSDSLFPNMNTGYPMWDGYPAFSAKPKKEEKVGLAEAITSSILSTGWWSGFNKRSCSCSGGKGTACMASQFVCSSSRAICTLAFPFFMELMKAPETSKKIAACFRSSKQQHI
ncbi:hypothetical protein ACFX13_022657 [Malus domestica]